METLIGAFRCLLPARYWKDARSGAYLSMLLTAALGVRIGYSGFFDMATRTGAEAATRALEIGAPSGGVSGMDQTTAIQAALQGTALVPFAFFLFTPLGWLSDYLVLSAVFRGFTLAADNPWGDPLLTGLDHLITARRANTRARQEAEARERAEGPAVPDQILQCRKFDGKVADFVVVASRRKEGWTLATTVVARSIRLRLGEPKEMTIEGRLRTCYPLSVIRDIQVDRRIVHYDWPEEAPPLPDPGAEVDPWRDPGA